MARATCAQCKTPWFHAWPACEACGCPAQVPIVDPREPDEEPDDGHHAPRPTPLDDVPALKIRYLRTGDPDVDAALGGGLATCGAYLLTGGPSAGKTTLALRALGRHGGLLLSCEMPPPMVRHACAKVGVPTGKILVHSPDDLDDALALVGSAHRLVVVDSLGRLPGRPPVVPALAALLDATKRQRGAGLLCLVVIAQQTKDGQARGSLELEHDVDGVIELDKSEVRVPKHRLGASETRARASLNASATSTEKRRSP